MELRGFVLAAGFGSRIAEISKFLPKPLLPILDDIALDLTVSRLERAGIEQITINAHHHSEKIAKHLEMSRYKATWSLSLEPKILGTGGGLQFAWNNGDRYPYLIHNADIVTSLELTRLISQHEESRPLATLLLLPFSPPDGKGVYIEGNEIVGFRHFCKTTKPDDCVGFAGIHIAEPELSQYLPQDGFSDVIDAYIEAIQQGKRIEFVMAPGGYDWFDIGTPQQYYETHKALLDCANNSAKLAGFGFANPDAVFSGVLKTDPTCFTRSIIPYGSTLSSHSFVLNGATIGSNCRVASSLVFPNAHVANGAAISNSIVTPWSTIPL